MSKRFAWVIAGLLLAACNQTPTTPVDTGTTTTGGGGGGSTSDSPSPSPTVVTSTVAPTQEPSTSPTVITSTISPSTEPSAEPTVITSTVEPSAIPTPRPTPTPMPTATPFPQGAAYLTYMADENQGQIQLAQLALQVSTNAAVRSFAQVLLSDHNTATQSIQTAAQAENLTVTGAPTAMQQTELQALATESGNPFDQAFVQYEIGATADEANAAQSEIVHGTDSAGGNLAQNLFKVFQAHQADAAQAQRQLPSPTP